MLFLTGPNLMIYGLSSRVVVASVSFGWGSAVEDQPSGAAVGSETCRHVTMSSGHLDGRPA